MLLTKPSIRYEWSTPDPLLMIERAGRTCYQSKGKNPHPFNTEMFVRMLIKNGHLAMIEHATASYRVICDRGVSHEIVRHRLFSYAQESTRYCNYKGGVEFIIPPWVDDITPGIKKISSISNPESYNPNINPHVLPSMVDMIKDENTTERVLFSTLKPFTHNWLHICWESELVYSLMLNGGFTPQQARTVLPNSLKTEIVITGNLREWLHFFNLRCAKDAHPQMKEIAFLLLADIQRRIPVIFEMV